MVNGDFHPFPRLPLELREEIWRLCLPHRVHEIDNPLAYIVYNYEDEKHPCSLTSTSKSNVRPPLVARVCRESRRVACTTGKWIPSLSWRQDAWSAGEPCEADWKTGKVIDKGIWKDTVRNSAHMNWEPCCDVDSVPEDPGETLLTSLVEEAKPLRGTPSFMLNAMSESWERNPPSMSHWDYLRSVFGPTFRPPPPEDTPTMTQREQNLAALRSLPEWKVVVKVIVIHLDIGRAADSGLFGLTGDEIIQVVDAALPLASQLFDLAEWCERGASAVTVAQDFTRMSYADTDAMVKREAVKHLQDHVLVDV